MATNNTMRVSELDFNTIKANLITFLQSQETFSDYNYSGSALNTIVDLLAYNTHYNAIIANQIVNESFLDSCVTRGSAVSHAKSLGYYPSSYKSAKAIVDITVNSPPGSPTSLILSKGSQFTTIIDNKTFTFITLDSIEIAPVAGIYTFSNVSLYEGTLATYSYIVDTGDTLQKFIIPSQYVDLSSVKVYVQKSVSDTTLTLFTQSDDITRLTPTTNAYFIQGTINNFYEIYFGDDVLGKAVADGNIVIIEYVITSGSSANNAQTFRSKSTIGGSSSITISTSNVASGGAESETLESIKRNAPLAYTAQNRMVTIEDVKTLLPLLYSNIRSVSAWGGEENVPPDYGVVYISITPLNYGTLTEFEKTQIINIITEKKILSIKYVIVDPEYIYLNIESTAYYDKVISLYGTEAIKLLVKNTIIQYNNMELAKFNAPFRFSKLSSLIDATDKCILSNITKVKLKKYIIPVYGISTEYVINFYNPIYRNLSQTPNNSVSSSPFTISNDDRTYYFEDDGEKYIRLYYLRNTTKIYVNNNIGTVDYDNGTVTIDLNVSTFFPVNDNDLGIEIIIIPESNDVIPVRNTILRIREEDIVTNALVDPSSGVNYVFTSSH
ncbi:MAG: hypothetical protein PHG08_00330 [Bacilli bacterium]|nr:hypothetical protein [Bacilli bacterium]